MSIIESIGLSSVATCTFRCIHLLLFCHDRSGRKTFSKQISHNRVLIFP